MTQTKSRIPEFQSIAEEAAIWNTHDTADFEDEFKVVKMRVAKPLEHIFSVRLDSKTLTTTYSVKQTARDWGRQPTLGCW